MILIGTIHWCGVINGDPAVEVSYYGGAAVWSFHEGRWRGLRVFESHVDFVDWALEQGVEIHECGMAEREHLGYAPNEGA